MLCMKSSSGLPKDFPKHIVPKVVGAIQRAYDVNYEHYDPTGAGHNGWTFGVQVHRSLCYFIDEELDGDLQVRIKRIRNSIEVRAGGFVLRPQKLPGADQSVWEALPNNPHTAEAMARENVKASPALPGVEFGEPTHFIIGHNGTPTGGCTTVHLCAPAKGWDEALGWERAVKVFDASEEAAAVDAEKGTQELAPSEDIPDVVIEPRAEVGEEENEEEGGT
jgi:hypothetical protein